MPINVDAADWNKAYEAHQNKQMTQKRAAQRSEAGDREEGSIVVKENRLAKINGYSVKRALGKGAFGEVFLGIKDGAQFAIKALTKLKKGGLGKPGAKGASTFDSAKAEIATLKKIQHPNCVHLFDVIFDHTHGQVFLVLEYVDGGVSQKTLPNGDLQLLPERVIWSHLRHFVMGLEYLHMHGIVHRDIKPENLMVTRPGRMYAGGAGVLKITDFGTSCFCEGDANAQHTAGTPPFFAPELCSKELSGTYDARVVDLWAAGVTIYMWICGRPPIPTPPAGSSAAATVMLMHNIANVEPQIAPPPEASEGLAVLITSLLTKKHEERLTLSQLRLHKWLTDGGEKPLPMQPVERVNITDADIAQAVTNREAMKVGSSAGPSSLGAALSLIGQGDRDGGWQREGVAAIRKRSTQAAADFWGKITASGHLAPHLPIVYSIEPVDADGNGSIDQTADGRDLVYDIHMQDLVAPMARPCAMAFVLGNRTVTQRELADQKPRAELLAALTALDDSTPTDDERAVGGVSALRYLTVLDSISSTSSLGLRIDSAKTIIDGELEILPLPDGLTFNTLKNEDDLVAALRGFLQEDTRVAHAVLRKVQTARTAMERSSFLPSHVFLRSTLLLVYDDAARTARLELKMMNFPSCYELPAGASVNHTSAWDGTAECHEDGYLLGMRSLERLVLRVCDELGEALTSPRSAGRWSRKAESEGQVNAHRKSARG